MLAEKQRRSLDECFDSAWVELDRLVIQISGSVVVALVKLLLGFFEDRLFFRLVTGSSLGLCRRRIKRASAYSKQQTQCDCRDKLCAARSACSMWRPCATVETLGISGSKAKPAT